MALLSATALATPLITHDQTFLLRESEAELTQDDFEGLMKYLY